MPGRTTKHLGEYVIVTFTRLSDGQPLIEVFAGYGSDRRGHMEALDDAHRMATNKPGMTGPPPIVRVVRAGELFF